MKKVIGVDCDETLSETMDALLEFGEHPILKTIKKSDLSVYAFWKSGMYSISPEEGLKVFYDLFHSDDFRKIKPTPGAFEKLSSLKLDGYSFVVITGRGQELELQTREWLDIHYPGIFEDVIFSSAHTKDEIPKSVLCKNHGITSVIEDNLRFSRDLAENGIHVFLLERPRNKDYDPTKDGGITKFSSWNDIYF